VRESQEHLDSARLEIGDDTLEEWQSLVDLIAELAGIPAGLIMRLKEEDIEVLVSSRTEGNPYSPGDREHFDGSGLYCEAVVKTGKKLLVPDAEADPDWRDNPDVKLGMISYLGYPLLLPDGVPFGTICILDSAPNSYPDAIHQLILKLRDLVQYHLELLYMNAVLSAENRRFSDHLEEIQALRGLIPICAWCKRIKDDEGYWRAVEEYLVRHPTARFTHGMCPDCVAQERL